MDDRGRKDLVIHRGWHVEMVGRTPHVQRGPFAVRTHVQDRGRSRHPRQPLHGRGVDALPLQRHQRPVGLFIVTDSTYGQTAQVKLCGIDHCATSGCGNGQADTFDEIHVSPVGDVGDGVSQDIQNIQPDDRHILPHVSLAPHVNALLSRAARSEPPAPPPRPQSPRPAAAARRAASQAGPCPRWCSDPAA